MRRMRDLRVIEVADLKLFIAVSARRRAVTQTHRGLLCVAHRKEIEDRQDGKCGRDYSCKNGEFHFLLRWLCLYRLSNRLIVFEKLLSIANATMTLAAKTRVENTTPKKSANNTIINKKRFLGIKAQ